ncbi:MAG: hypothetical protein OXG02_11115 [Chloroflexi bacterium]|nr:hypothetical protein [Chloroflexota bacterium]
MLVFAIAIHTPQDPDTWWHLRSAEHTLTQGIIRQDPFSFTRAGEDWLNHSWGGQLLLWAAWKAGGDLGLALFTASLAVLGMMVVGRMLAATAANAHLRAYLLVFCALTASVFWSARPQMLSFCFSAMTLWFLRRGGRGRWFLPLLFILWANVHAGFAVGLLYLALSALASGYDAFTNRWRLPRVRASHWLLLIAACLIALCLNPYGAELLLIPLRTLTLSELHTSIREWQTPNLHQPTTWPFLCMLALTLSSLALSRRRPPSSEVFVITATTLMALWAGRHIALFALAATPTLGAQLAALPLPRRWRLPPPPRMSAARGWAHLVLVTLLGLGVALYTAASLAEERIEEIQSAQFPVAAVQHLRETQPAGPLFHTYEWGGYLLWHAPNYPSFIDGRTLLFGDELLAAYRRAANGDDWSALFQQHQIRLVLIRRNSGLDRSLRRLPLDWERRHLDETAVLYARREG